MVAFDYEIANINISVNDDASATTEIQGEPETSAFAWHYDSFPFVCVTMLSDCSDMVGGETAIRTSSGEIKKIRGPSMVSLKVGNRIDCSISMLMELLGYCCSYAGPLHRASSVEGPGRLRTYQHGDSIPTTGSIHSG